MQNILENKVEIHLSSFHLKKGYKNVRNYRRYINRCNKTITIFIYNIFDYGIYRTQNGTQNKAGNKKIRKMDQS